MAKSTTPATPPSHKRTYDQANNADNDKNQPQSPLTGAASSILTPISGTPSRGTTAEPERQGSPAPSGSSSAPTTTNKSNAAGGPPNKKRKLTFIEKEAEKAAKRLEKEEKEKQKLEEKTRKEEEKRIRDVERQRKEEEKEAAKRERELAKAEKQKTKDAEKHAKEEKRRREEEAEAKKKKAQPSVLGFFAKPTTKTQPPPAASSLTADAEQMASTSRRSSLASTDSPMVDTPAQTPARKSRLAFLPYELPSHTLMAPIYACERDVAAMTHALSRIEDALRNPSDMDIEYGDALAAFKDGPFAHQGRGLLKRKRRTVREIVNQRNGTAAATSDQPGEAARGKGSKIEGVPIKILYFSKDVRPPYMGTYSREIPSRSATRLSRNPFTRELPETNYDYDSEAEWEPPQEGDEDLESGDEEDEEEDGDDDMDGFLDDESDHGPKRGHLGANDLLPVSTGLVWANATNNLVIGKVDLNEYRIDVLDDAHQFPIDPYSTKYWPTPATAHPATVDPSSKSTSMQPPSRSPLTSAKPTSAIFNQGILAPGAVSLAKQPPPTTPIQASPAGRGRPPTDPSKPLKMIASDLLPAFKEAVAGSNLSKAGLIEVLKKEFPKIAKDVIKDTLTAVAMRQGVKEADKVWVVTAP